MSRILAVIESDVGCVSLDAEALKALEEKIRTELANPIGVLVLTPGRRLTLHTLADPPVPAAAKAEIAPRSEPKASGSHGGREPVEVVQAPSGKRR